MHGAATIKGRTVEPVKTVNWDLVEDGDALVLVTAEEVVAGLEVKMADFRDTHALYYGPLRAWLGLSRVGLELGTETPRMERGLWYVRRDDALCAAHVDLEPDVSAISLRRIG